ncbi:MAG: elongation factor P [Candidatus Omnitrophica bacterium]|nr:elongation factor P [Candidatus Omnitrophota bacterium]
MPISTNQFKTGMALVIDGELYSIVEFQHVKPGKGAAFVRTKLRSFKTGNVLNKTYDAGERFEDAFIEKKPMQFQYRAGDQYHFMDLNTYDQPMFTRQALGEAADFLTPNLEVKGQLWNGQLVGMDLPTTVDLKIAESDPGLRGDTSKSAMKPAVMETGLKVQVPLFVGPGDVVKVDTRTGEYAGRA